MNRNRVPMRNGHGASHGNGRGNGHANGNSSARPAQGQLPLPNPNAEPFLNRLERRCAEDPDFLKRLADAVREIGADKSN